jgi:hypothetical protein
MLSAGLATALLQKSAPALERQLRCRIGWGNRRVRGSSIGIHRPLILLHPILHYRGGVNPASWPPSDSPQRTVEPFKNIAGILIMLAHFAKFPWN